MNRPKMIIFEYGQTLVDEKAFDGLKGTAAVLMDSIIEENREALEELSQ